MLHVVDMVMMVVVTVNLPAVVHSMPIMSNFLRILPHAAIGSAGSGKR
jgi:hypothetical protein